MGSSSATITPERVKNAIYVMRGERVMVDRDLATLYGVSSKVFNQSVKRHKNRFPEDFMFQLTTEEARNWWLERMATRLRSQSVTLKRGQHLKYRPFVFTEHGILMLSSVLNSERAIQVNIEIMRAFVRLRKLVAGHRELTAKLTELERRVASHDEHIEAIFNAIRQLMTPPPARVKQIGFRPKALEK
jgi:phage regulator Rha-like protein